MPFGCCALHGLVHVVIIETQPRKARLGDGITQHVDDFGRMLDDDKFRKVEY